MKCEIVFGRKKRMENYKGQKEILRMDMNFRKQY